MKKIYLLSLFSFFLFLVSSSSALAKKPTAFTKFQITNEGHQQNSPHISGKIVVWTDWRGEDLDIWMYNLDSQKESSLIIRPKHQVVYGIWEDKVVYRDENTTPASMRILNIKSGKDIIVASGDNVVGGAIYENKVVYVDGYSSGKLYLYNLVTKKTRYIADNVYGPSIWGNKIVWTRGQNDRIKGYNLVKNDFFEITTKEIGSQNSPDIFGQTVVWSDTTNGKSSIYQKNLLIGKEEIVYESNTENLGVPTLSDQYIAWVNDRGTGAHDIFAYNRKTKEIIEISNDGPQQPSPTIPDIWGNTVVWMSWHTGNGDIYVAKLFKQPN